MCLNKKVMVNTEIWVAVKGYDGLYEVSNMGRVRSLDFVIQAKGTSKKRQWRGCVLKQGINTAGYYVVSLHLRGKSSTRQVHQLVAIGFLNHQIGGRALIVNHIDGEKLNNRVDNLEIVTYRQNNSTCFRKNTEKYTSKYVGVCLDKKSKKWIASIMINKKIKYLGSFKEEIEASKAYQAELALL